MTFLQLLLGSYDNLFNIWKLNYCFNAFICIWEKPLSGQHTLYLFVFIRAVTIHQTHDSVRITIFDPRFGSYHDFFVGGGRKKKKDF